MNVRVKVGSAVLSAGIALFATGCSSTPDTVDQALRESSSAVASGRLALELYTRDSSTFALADTALGDALTELDGAQSEVAEAEAAGASESTVRQRALDVIRSGVDAVSAARDELSAGSASGIADAVDALESAEKQLDAAGGGK
ncbi:hypothetical protein [Agreia sp.]|uniref:hypothetical protein n=1 Tax=Agreia sp. TaxID=1872416 RepID=UPI0035BC15D6